MKKGFYGLVVAVALATVCASAFAETAQERDKRMKWWREARFGMFIHWGVYSVPAGIWKGEKIGSLGEWIMCTAQIPVADYTALTKQFNPVKFDADEWVRLAKDAGMKYIVITSKHHDGFAMFHSKASAFNIYDATPFKRDPLKELADACKKHNMRLGFYYSQAQDWCHPGGAACGAYWDKAQEDHSMDDYLRDVAVPQVREILSNYGKVSVLWWDTACGMTKERADVLLPLLSLQPGIITNNRLGGGYAGDSETPEQTIPATGMPGRDWETCMTINDTWGFKSWDENWKSTEILLRNLIDIASKGGNYLLNVGPTSLGEIPEASVDRLKEVGRWMKVNGRSIYGTSPSPFKRLSFEGRCTVKGRTLYLHVFEWPSGGVTLTGLKTRVKGASFLDGNKRAEFTQDAVGKVIVRPPGRVDPIATVVALTLDGEVKVDDSTVSVTPDADGSLRLGAADAVVHGDQARFESANGQGNIGYWTNASDWVSWIVEVPSQATYDIAATYACPAESAGASGDIEVEGSSGTAGCSYTVGSTGSWTAFETRKLGYQIGLKAGKHTVAVKVKSMPHGAVMNLREVLLTPVR